MDKLEKSKERLKDAFIHFEYSIRMIETELVKLRKENKMLKEKIYEYNNEKSSGIDRKRGGKSEIRQRAVGSTSLINDKVSTEIDLSLKELKKLVGQ